MSSFAVTPRASRARRRPLLLLLAATLMAGLLPVLSEATVSGAATPSVGQGVWLVAQDGGIFSHGEAPFFGSTGSVKLNQPVVGMAGTPSMKGYWMVAADGGIFSFGDAGFYGSTGAMKLNKPIVGMASTPSGKGYWMVATDGGIFSFGDAAFYGSTGGLPLVKPIVGMASTASSKGYWMVASDGGLFSFGDAKFYGSSAGTNRTVVGMVPSPTGLGYYQATDTGEVIGFGDAYLSAPAAKLNQKMIGLAAAHKPAGTGDPTATTGNPTDPTTPTTTTPTTVPGTAGLLTPAQKVAQSGKPNVMVILMDDMRVEGLMDNPTVLPKTKQWLVSGGSTYSEGFATTPLCCPERATIWTGQLPHNHGVVDNYDGAPLNKDWISPRYMKEAGYRTSLVGKFITDWHMKYTPPHFDDYAAFQGGYVDVPFMVKNPGDTVSHGERTSRPEDSPTGDDSSDYIGDKVAQFVTAYEANDAQPWYMHVAPHAPHDDVAAPFFKWPARFNDTPVSPYEPTPAALIEGLDSPNNKIEKNDKADAIRSKSITRSDVEVYHDGMLKTLLAADEAIDKMMRTLQEKGELDNTLVIFTSDNGFSWGERGVDSKGWPYVEDTIVPFLARWDGVIPAGAVNTRPVGGEDILPTMLDAAQYTPATYGQIIDGKSFLPNQPAKDVKFLEFGPKIGTSPTLNGSGCSDPIGPACYAPHRGIPTWASLRTPDYQYIEWYESDNTTLQVGNGRPYYQGREYYDLKTDPWQLNNLLADQNPANDPPNAGALSERLKTLRSCVGSACP